MRKRFLMATTIVSALTLSACDDLFGGDEVTVTVTGKANVRDAASTEGSSVVGKLEAGTELKGEWIETGTGPQDKWLEFDLDGKKAFIWAGNLSENGFSSKIKQDSQYENAQDNQANDEKIASQYEEANAFERIDPLEIDPIKESDNWSRCAAVLFYFSSVSQYHQISEANANPKKLLFPTTPMYHTFLNFEKLAVKILKFNGLSEGDAYKRSREVQKETLMDYSYDNFDLDTRLKFKRPLIECKRLYDYTINNKEMFRIHYFTLNPITMNGTEGSSLKIMKSVDISN